MVKRILAAVWTVTVLSVNTGASVVMPRPADELVESMGICTHFSYTNSIYVTRFADIKPRLGELGIRYIRDRAEYLGWQEPARERIRELYRDLGIRVDLTFNLRTGAGNVYPLDLTMIDTLVSTIPAYGAACVSVEGPNEYNDRYETDPAWDDTLRSYMQKMHTAVRSGSRFDSLPVVGPTIWMRRQDHYQELGDVSAYMDRGNLHYYTGARIPTLMFGTVFTDLEITAGTKPVWVTEFGYQNALNAPANTHRPITEYSEAKYLPRSYLEFFIHPRVERAFSYELMDDPDPELDDVESNFGLLRSDLTGKPVFTALKNLIGLTEDPGVPFTPVPLELSLEGDTTDVHYSLLQKRNGTYLLIIWQDVDSYDRDTQEDLHPADRSLVVKTGMVMDSVRTWLPAPAPIGNGSSPMEEYTAADSIALSVPDQLLIVEMKPGPAGVLLPEREPVLPRFRTVTPGQLYNLQGCPALSRPGLPAGIYILERNGTFAKTVIR